MAVSAFLCQLAMEFIEVHQLPPSAYATAIGNNTLVIVHHRLNKVGRIGIVSYSKNTSFSKARLCRRSKPESGLLTHRGVLPPTIRLFAHVPRHDGLFGTHNADLTSPPSAQSQHGRQCID